MLCGIGAGYLFKVAISNVLESLRGDVSSVTTEQVRYLAPGRALDGIETTAVTSPALLLWLTTAKPPSCVTLNDAMAEPSSQGRQSNSKGSSAPTLICF
jgi:hypothetical protein